MKETQAWPRQPMVGVALAAMLGIAVADLCPSAWPAAVGAAICAAAIALFTGRSAATYLFVAVAFFALHEVRSRNSAGLQLAELIGDSPRAVTAHGFVRSEPKIASSGTATFTLSLS